MLRANSAGDEANAAPSLSISGGRRGRASRRRVSPKANIHDHHAWLALPMLWTSSSEENPAPASLESPA